MGITDDIGKGVGGLFRNPGILALGALAIGLIIFRVPITQAFNNFGKSIGGLFSSTGAIQAAGQEAGQFVFNIGQEVGGSVFDAGTAAGEAVFGAGVATGDFFGKLQKDIDQQLQNFFKVQQSNFEIFTSNFQKDIVEGFESIPDSAQKAAEEGGPLSQGFDFLSNLFGFGNVPPEFQGPAIFPQTGESTLLDPDRPLDLFQFAEKFGIQPQEAFQIEKQFGGLDFEAIAAIPTFGEVLAENPELTASQIANLKFIQAGGGGDFDFGTNTGSAFDFAGANFGQGDVDIELLKQAEALKAQATLGGGSGGLFANPDFPITVGEAFLGKSGTIVSQSISNLTDEQLKAFIEQFG